MTPLTILLGHLKAFHCLPQNTTQQPMRHPDEALLLSELQKQAQNGSPIRWLMEHHSDTIVKVWWWQQLHQLTSAIRLLNRDIRAGLGEYLVAPLEDLGYLHRLKELETVLPDFDNLPAQKLSETDLRGWLTSLHTMITTNQPRHQWRVVHQALSGNAHLSPLEWVKSNRLSDAAHSTLEYLITQKLPSSSVWETNSPLQEIQLHRKIRTLQAPFKLEKIAHFAHGFSLFITFRLHNRHLKQPVDNKQVSWACTADIKDDSGNCYVPAYYLLEYTKKLLFIVHYRLRIHCYPAINPNSQKLYITLRSPDLIAANVQAKRKTSYCRVLLDDIDWQLNRFR